MHIRKGPQKKRMIVYAFVPHALHHGRLSISKRPLASRNSDIYFTVKSMDALAELKWKGTAYRGFCNENDERPELRLDVPKDGLDIQHEPVYWDLPCGRTICCSPLQFIDMRDDELMPMDSDGAYAEIASLFGFDALGVVDGEKPEQLFANFREDVGTLADERWKQLAWKIPSSESSPCWWLVNATEPDKAQPPKLLSRSLACCGCGFFVKSRLLHYTA